MNAKLLFTLCILFYAVTIADGGVTYNQKCRKALPTSSNTDEISDFNNNNHYYSSQAVNPKDESSSDDDDDDDDGDDEGFEIILSPPEPDRIVFDDSGGWHFTRINQQDDVTSGNGNGGMQ